jgi:hypothetical protein
VDYAEGSRPSHRATNKEAGHGETSMFVGMDVHKESIDISIAEAGRTGEVRHYGVIAGDLEALDKVVRALRARGRGCTSSTRRGRVGLESTGISRRRGKRAPW